MQIIDIVRQYDACRAEPESYRQYELLFPELFEHYFRYWSNRSAPHCEVNQQTLEHQRDLILTALPDIVNQFERHHLGVGNLTVVLFVGVGTSNGHAYRHDGKFVVWLPVETFTSETLARVFVAHELAHALHYTVRPEFYFDSEDELSHFGRLLMTEGIATLATKEIMGFSAGEALWADYLDGNAIAEWQRTCVASYSDLARFAHQSFDRVDQRQFFQIVEPTDMYRNRAGYWVGMQALTEIAAHHGLSLTNLLHQDRASLSRLMVETLRSMAES